MDVGVERYGIHIASLDFTCGAELSKTRPVVVSQNEMSRHLVTVVVYLLTTKLYLRCRSRVQGARAGRKAEIAVDHVRTVGKKHFGRRVDHLEAAQAARPRQPIIEMHGE